MAKNERVVKYAGFSRVSNEKGERSVHFHTSNNSKYAVWSMLPETISGPGHQVSFTWFKLPADTTKIEAVRFLLNKENLHLDKETKAFLESLLVKAEPKPKKERKPKAPKAKKQKVTVVVAEKKLSDEDAAKVKEANLARIREAAAKRKEVAA